MKIQHKFYFFSNNKPPFHSGPFTSTLQTRFKKPANTAQTRLQTRTLDPKLDLLTFHQKRLTSIISFFQHFSIKKHRPFVSLNLLSRWALQNELTKHPIGEFLKKYPHLFDVFPHPVKRNECCRFTSFFVELVKRESRIVKEMEGGNVVKVEKILAMSVSGRVHVHAIRLMKREFGLPDDFVESVIRKYDHLFRMVGLEIVELVEFSEVEFTGEVEKWREKEYREKWLSEFETKYAFPINFPTGFRIVKGMREELRNWQRLSYVKVYERKEKVRVRTCGGVERYEKRAVGIIHELLGLTVERMVDVERLAHFRKDLGIEVNLREVLLRHPGIFYVSSRGGSEYVFLREAYWKGCLVGGDAVHDVRREMLDLMLLGRRHTREARECEEARVCEVVEVEDRRDVVRVETGGGVRDGDFVIPFLESCSNSNIVNSDHDLKT